MTKTQLLQEFLDPVLQDSLHGCSVDSAVCKKTGCVSSGQKEGLDWTGRPGTVSWIAQWYNCILQEEQRCLRYGEETTKEVNEGGLGMSQETTQPGGQVTAGAFPICPTPI